MTLSGVMGSSWWHFIRTIPVYWNCICMAVVAIWGSRWSNRNVCFYTDNEALFPAISKQTAHDPSIVALF